MVFFLENKRVMNEIYENNKKIETLSKQKSSATIFSWAEFGELAIQFAVITLAPLLIFLFLGNILEFLGLKSASQWANYHRHNSNLYIVIGLLASIFISFYTIFKKIMEIQKRLKK
jgi:magnesium-transporting ATPase (P-type)